MRVLPGLTTRNFAREALAGVTLVAIAVPLNIGYAQIAGLPPTAGLYALILPGIAYALLATTRQVVASPDAAAAALVASSLGGLAAAGGGDYLQLAFAQAIIGGVLLALSAAFKLGFLANFLSEPILIGFVGGLALDILVSQVAKMLGIKIDSGAEFLEKLGELVSRIATTNLWSVVIAVLALAVLIVGRKLLPRVPWALVVLVLSTFAVAVAGLEKLGVAVLGHVDAGLPQLAWPQLSLQRWLELTPSAAALTLVAMAEGLLLMRRYAQKNGYSTNPNRDLLALGAANIAAGVSGGFTVGSSTSRTAALDSIGSRTQLPTIVAAVSTLLLVVFGTALLADIPSPAIGAIVAVAVYPLLGIREFAELWVQRKFEFAIGAVCFLGAILLGPIWGILLAFVLSLLNLARRAANPPIDILRGANEQAVPVASGIETAPGIVVVRFSAPLFFANSAAFVDAITTVASTPGLNHIVLDCEAITDIDVTAAGSFKEIVRMTRERGIHLHLSRVRADLKAQLDEFELLNGVDSFETNREAVEKLSSPAGGLP
jgi:high affinity sulfate transporter 1